MMMQQTLLTVAMTFTRDMKVPLQAPVKEDFFEPRASLPKKPTYPYAS